MKTAWIRPSVLAPAAAVLLFLAGCSDDTGQPEPADAESSSPEMVQREAPAESTRTTPTTRRDSADFRVVPDVSGRLEQEGAGLDTVIDASSKQAYAESLRWIAEDASQEQMQRLERSIRFLHMYDPSIFGSEQQLLDSIDGMTGNEIIERALEMREQRERAERPEGVPSPEEIREAARNPRPIDDGSMR